MSRILSDGVNAGKMRAPTFVPRTGPQPLTGESPGGDVDPVESPGGDVPPVESPGGDVEPVESPGGDVPLDDPGGEPTTLLGAEHAADSDPAGDDVPSGDPAEPDGTADDAPPQRMHLGNPAVTTRGSAI